MQKPAQGGLYGASIEEYQELASPGGISDPKSTRESLLTIARKVNDRIKRPGEFRAADFSGNVPGANVKSITAGIGSKGWGQGLNPRTDIIFGDNDFAEQV